MRLNPDDPRLTAYALGELPEADRAAIEQALRESPESRRVVEETGSAATLLSSALATEPCPQLDREQRQAVLTALESTPTAERGMPTWLSRFWWRPAVFLGGAAAGVVLILVLQNFRKTSPPEPSTTLADDPIRVPPAVAAQSTSTSEAQVVQAVRPTLNTPPLPVPQPPIKETSRPPVIANQPVVNVNRETVAPVVAPVSPPVTTVVQVAEATGPVLALAPLPLRLPMPSFKGTPDDLPKGPNIEPFSDKPRAAFMAPAGVKNVALNKKVTCSDKSPITGSVSQLTDGNKEAIDDAVVELHKNVQWVQVDLEQEFNLYAILVWHDHRYVQVFRCVVVQTADDPDFTRNVQTLFNNDLENVAGLGLGQDKQYFETNQGKLIDAQGLKARYLRFYSKGSNASALNCYTEIEVYGLPAQ